MFEEEDLHDDRCQRTPSYVNPLIQPSLSPHSDCNHGTAIHKSRTKIFTPVFLVIITIASVMFALAAPHQCHQCFIPQR